MNLNINRTHPIIPQPDTTGSKKYFVSISSEDRNITKYPDANNFVLDLPQEYTNVESVSLSSSYFPIVDTQFSYTQNNVDLCFRLTKAFNPSDVSGVTPQDLIIYSVVCDMILRNDYIRIRIGDGRYTTTQMLNEVQNRMNVALTDKIADAIWGTTRLFYWGDIEFALAEFPGAAVQTDASPARSQDGWNLSYNTSYANINDAITAFNNLYSMDIPLVSGDADWASALVLELTSGEINALAINHTAKNPPILMCWAGVHSYTDNYVGKQLYDEVEKRYSDSYVSELTRKAEFLASGGYQHFKLVYDKVQSKMVFGNHSTDFAIITDIESYYSHEVINKISTIALNKSDTYKSGEDTARFMPQKKCASTTITPYINDVKWGLPVYLGIDGTEITREYKWNNDTFRGIPGYNLPTFSHFTMSSDDYQPFTRIEGGYSRASIFTFTPAYQIDLKGEPYFYLDMDTLNTIDELVPYKNNEYTTINNQTTGIINASFAKLPLTILDDVAYGRGFPASKKYSPPLKRFHRIIIRLRFHNGRPVDFGVQQFSFVLEIVCKDNHIKSK